MENNFNNLNGLIQEVREWNKAWMAYDLTHKDKPASLGEFIKELDKKYKVEIKHED